MSCELPQSQLFVNLQTKPTYTATQFKERRHLREIYIYFLRKEFLRKIFSVGCAIDRYQVLGRVVHMDFVQEQLKTKKKVNFGDSQEQPNGIELEVMADTIYMKVCLTILYLSLVKTTIGP